MPLKLLLFIPQYRSEQLEILTSIVMIVGVSQHIDIPQYTKNLYRNDIRNAYRNIDISIFPSNYKTLYFSFNSCLVAGSKLKQTLRN